ncbi:cobalamin B12-binding domain-containing protein [[Kitasatospora] papulosa]|uniref:cobalamin B12-binding domain-containing protein n=1 Tax=[Kitasatospora] papulosa TaxID=1464011 RepID=UPI00362EBA23
MELSRIPMPDNPVRRRIIVTSTSSDSHIWNLVFLQLLLEEAGHEVANLGPCVSDNMLVSEALGRRPDLIVVSSVNGHGHHDGLRAINRLRRTPVLARTPVVIGGKLGIGGPDPQRSQTLLTAGFQAVFEGGQGDPEGLLTLIDVLPSTVSA